MKKIIFSIMLCSLVSGCSTLIFGPPKVEDYKGADYATLRVEEDGGDLLLDTYEDQNGCYKRIKTERLVEQKLSRPDIIRDTDHKIKAGTHYAVVSIYTSGCAGYIITHELDYPFIPVAGHIYKEGSYDLTAKTAALRWSLEQRCRGFL
ncbi:hypothetical protein Rahaq_5159 (plasmid) [Rahnella aceris]|uniref:Lipoprotein n=1 Tax=Rahnella sp. (strain Y9602) TaxID=2703885 RepID=A0A0H3FJ16_RAHSY|nr:hypothetical protein [Rahnella aceris]ADW76725.1 hypothetical protein Rahaq_5159 [Rahnella aceris]